MKESFVLYKSFYEPIKGLSSEDKGNLLDAIFQYQIEGFEPPNTSPIYMAFLFFKNQFRLDNEKYLSVVERNKSNGIKGGRPPKQETQTNPNNPVGFSEPKKADNDNDNDNDNEKGKVKEIKDIVVTPHHPLQDYINKNFERVSKMKIQMTYENCETIIQENNKQAIIDTLEAMENYKDLSKRISVYLTLKKWLKNDFNKSKPSQSKLESMANNAMEALNILNNG